MTQPEKAAKRGGFLTTHWTVARGAGDPDSLGYRAALATLTATCSPWARARLRTESTSRTEGASTKRHLRPTTRNRECTGA